MRHLEAKVETWKDYHNKKVVSSAPQLSRIGFRMLRATTNYKLLQQRARHS